jgi:hypothetical protein
MAKTNNDRKYPDGTSPRPDLTYLKKEDAKERQTYYDGLTLDQKIEKLDAKLGKGVGARKQRAQFAALLNTDAPTETIISDIIEEDGTTKLKAKERRKKEQR